MRLLRWLVLSGLGLVMASCGGGGLQVAHAQCVAASQVTLSGTLRASNGLPASNDVITLTPSQVGFVAGCGVNVISANTCATSTDGTVVGLPNPLSGTVISTTFTGTLPAGTYYVTYSWYDASGATSLASPETIQQLSAQGSIVVNLPVSGLPDGAVGMRVYISTTSGTETLQGSTTGNSSFNKATPLVAGSAMPGTNGTTCKVTANDAIWPTGTGYKVSLVDQSGNAFPGFPMQWQLMGPGTTINLSNGLPYYHGVVMYPSAILASPAAHGQQSISGPLSLMGYVFLAGGIGIGTNTPGFPLDVASGFINTNFGYMIGANAGTSGQCLLSGGPSGPDTWGNCLTSLPSIYYQQWQRNAVVLPSRGIANFSTFFTLTDNPSGGGKTEVDVLRTGNGARATTSTAAGVSTHCANWDAAGNVGDAGGPCLTSSTDYYFHFTASCTIAQTGNTYNCDGSTLFSAVTPTIPTTLPNTNYETTCTPEITVISATFNLHTHTTTGLTYNWGQYMGNATGGGAIAPVISCHIHMNP